MTSAPDVLTAMPEAPSLLGAALRLGLAVTLLAVGAAAFLYWQRKKRGGRSQLEVMDRAFLARGSSVVLLRVEARRLLVGVSPEGVRLLRDLDVGLERKRPASFPAVLEDVRAAVGAVVRVERVEGHVLELELVADREGEVDGARRDEESGHPSEGDDRREPRLPGQDRDDDEE